MKFLKIIKVILAIIGVFGFFAIVWVMGAIEQDLFAFKQELILAIISLAIFGGGTFGSIAVKNEIEYRQTRRFK